MPGSTIEQFVRTSRSVNPPMKDAVYQNHIQAMSIRMEQAIADQIDIHKAQILGEFPLGIRLAVSLAWAAMKRIGTWIAEALVFVVLAYLATKTIEEVAELIVRHRSK